MVDGFAVARLTFTPDLLTPFVVHRFRTQFHVFRLSLKLTHALTSPTEIQQGLISLTSIHGLKWNVICSSISPIFYFWPKLNSPAHQILRTFDFLITPFTLLIPKSKCLCSCSLFSWRLPGLFNRKFQLMYLKLRFLSFIPCVCIVYRPPQSADYSTFCITS